MGTILSGNFQEERVVIAGNPGKIVKRNINWSSLRPNQFEEKAETLVVVERVIPLIRKNRIKLRKVA